MKNDINLIRHNTSTYGHKGNGNISLSKNFYGVQKALDILDEEFNEFALKARNYKEFFNHYNKYFYSLDDLFHSYVLERSIEAAYSAGYTHPKQLELNDLQEQLFSLQEEIDSQPKSIFFIPNQSFIIKFVEALPDQDKEIVLTNALKSGEDVFYIHSGKKRKISNYQTYLNIKNKLTQGNIKTNKEFVNEIHIDTINKIPEGPSIPDIESLGISNLEVNIYPQTVEQYFSKNSSSPLRVKYGLNLPSYNISEVDNPGLTRT